MLETQANADFVFPKVWFMETMPKHTLENTGAEDLVVIAIELKRSRVD